MSITITDLLLREVMAERSDAIVVALGTNAAIQIPQSVDVIAHFVLDGHVTIAVDQLEPVTMHRGEYGLLMYGNQHTISVDDNESIKQNHVIDTWPVGDEPATLSLGTGKPGAKLISAALRLVNTPVSIQNQHPLSELLHLKHGLGPFFKDTALLMDVSRISEGCRGFGANAFINALLNLHLTHAMRCQGDHLRRTFPLLATPAEIFRSPTIRPVSVAVRLMRLHPEVQWTVASLAQEVGQSRSSFAARFRTAVGIGPMEYLNNVRMEKAAELLQSRHDLSLCIIARQVGYDSANSFARAFKAHFHLPPRRFSNQDCLEAIHGRMAINDLTPRENGSVKSVIDSSAEQMHGSPFQ